MILYLIYGFGMVTVPCLPFPGLPHIYFQFTVRLRIFHVCRNENFRNSYLSFYWKKWFYIWYMALAWWLVLCLPFPGLPHIYFLFIVQLTNEWVGVFLARGSMQHLVLNRNYSKLCKLPYYQIKICISLQQFDQTIFAYCYNSLIRLFLHIATTVWSDYFCISLQQLDQTIFEGHIALLLYSICLNFFHLLARKPNLEKNSIYSDKFFYNFHLSESSFTCPALRASGLVRRLAIYVTEHELISVVLTVKTFN
jgi:hypothetical protein